MSMTLESFIKKWNGKKADWDGAYGGQCVDLFRFFNHEVLEIDQPKGVVGAADFWTNYPTDPILKTNFTKIDNTPDFTPLAGDVVIWDKNAGGGYGHIAIATGENSGLKYFKSFDQNWSRVSYCEVINHTYKNVLGVIRPKNYSESPNKLLAHIGVSDEESAIKVWDQELKFLEDEREKVQRLKIDLDVEEKTTKQAIDNHQRDIDMLAEILGTQSSMDSIEKEVKHLLSVEEEKRKLQKKLDDEMQQHKKTYEEAQEKLQKLSEDIKRLEEKNKLDREDFEKKLIHQQQQIDAAIKKSNESKKKIKTPQNEVNKGFLAWLISKIWR